MDYKIYTFSIFFLLFCMSTALTEQALSLNLAKKGSIVTNAFLPKSNTRTVSCGCLFGVSNAPRKTSLEVQLPLLLPGSV